MARKNPFTPRSVVGVVAADDAAAAIREPIEESGRNISPEACGVAAAATGGYLSFLVAMANNDGPSRLSDVAERLGVSNNYAIQYRLRLIQAELIEATGRGELDFAMPYLREYLRQHAASLGLNHDNL